MHSDAVRSNLCVRRLKEENLRGLEVQQRLSINADAIIFGLPFSHVIRSQEQPEDVSAKTPENNRQVTANDVSTETSKNIRQETANER